MKQLSAAAVERAMKLQDVMLRAMAKRITWYQAAEILGISCRQMQRWKTRFEHEGYEGLFDRRRGIPSPKRVPLETVETVLRLYQEQYFDFNVRHFHEKLSSEHQLELSYTWVSKRCRARVWSRHDASAANTGNGGHEDPCRGCCCTSMLVSIAGSATIAGTTCW